MSVAVVSGLRNALRTTTRRPCRHVHPDQLLRRWNSTLQRQWSTSLAKDIAEAITTTGPVPIASYMRQCLTSPNGGYYTTNRPSPDSKELSDQFGKSGDFVTSPEISQVFGELVGIFFVAEWLAQGQPSDVHLIELGPGRGTLMSDMLRAIGNFKEMASKLNAIWLVEASPTLREAQWKMLCSSESPLKETEIGWTSTCKLPHLSKVPVHWVEDMNFLPKDSITPKTPFIIAHEFFDALPIHAFESVKPSTNLSTSTSSTSGITTSTTPTPSPKPAQTTKPNEWRELLVSPTPPPSIINPPKTPPPDFHLTKSRTPTAHSSYLPTISQRYKNLLPSEGSSIEISPESLSISTTIAQLIGGAPLPSASNPPPSSTQMRRPRADGPATSAVTQAKAKPSGAALIVDYGPTSTIPVNSLRGIKRHQVVSPFSGAGTVDLSADVDFGALVETSLNASEGVEVHGPVEQGVWLNVMGGGERVLQILRGLPAEDVDDAQGSKDDGKSVEGSGEATESERKRVEGAWRRLIDRGPNGMGKVYKVLAVTPHLKGSEGRKPVGFGGDVVQ